MTASQYTAASRTVSRRVPQSLILGPLLWNMKCDDIVQQNYLDPAKLMAFTDSLTALVVTRDSIKF